MATKKLSEALAALQAAANVSGLTVRIVTAGQNETEKAQTITLAQLLTALGVPTVQTDAAGTANKYIYSNLNDKTKGALSGVFKVYQYAHELYLRHKYWGSSDNYDDGQYATVKIPYCTTSADGVMEWEYLVRLRNATLTETGTTTGVNITYPNFADGGTKTLTLTAATTAKAGVMTVDQVNALTQATTDIASLNSRVLEVSTLATTAQRSANSASMTAQAAQSGVNAITPYTDTLQKYIVGEMGSYDSADAFDSALINMTKATHQNGRYFAKVGDVPLFVTFEVLNNAANILCQWVEGAVTVGANGKIFTNTTQGTRIISRIYSDGVWGEWKASALTDDLPTVQTDAAGTNHNYIYQDLADPTKYVMSGVGKFFQYNSALKLRLKLWGTGNRDYADGKYSTFDCPQVTAGADGAMNHDVYGRITNNTISEVGSTTEAVNVNYTNFANGGANTLTLSKATTAKAGVMTASQVQSLNSLSSHIIDLGSYTDESAALNKIGELEVCANKKLIHAHLTYAISEAESTTLILIQSIDRDYCRQFIFNKGRVFTRGISFTDTTLTQISYIEDFTFMFADRLQWNTDNHGYNMSQFGTGFGQNYCDPIPLASTTAHGLMSQEDKQLLEKIKAQLNL